MRRARSALLVVVLVAACGDGRAPAPPSPATAAIGEGAIALVGTTRIEAPLVSRVATAQGTSARTALGALVDDAVFAEAARATALHLAPDVAWSIRATRARFVADRIREDARALGLPSGAELADVTARHWFELDTPEQVRVVHAVVLRSDRPAPESDERERTLAAELVARLADAPTVDEFERRARALAAGSSSVKVERLPPFVLDGRIAAPSGGEIDHDFARAAFSLAAPGSTSGVVRSKFGWHVIRLEERIPARHVPLDERRELLAAEVLTGRARAAFDATLARLRSATPIAIATDSESLMASVPVSAP